LVGWFASDLAETNVGTPMGGFLLMLEELQDTIMSPPLRTSSDGRTVRGVYWVTIALLSTLVLSVHASDGHDTLKAIVLNHHSSLNTSLTIFPGNINPRSCPNPDCDHPASTTHQTLSLSRGTHAYPSPRVLAPCTRLPTLRACIGWTWGEGGTLMRGCMWNTHDVHSWYPPWICMLTESDRV
jgi:hypothetical protein